MGGEIVLVDHDVMSQSIGTYLDRIKQTSDWLGLGDQIGDWASDKPKATLLWVILDNHRIGEVGALLPVA